MGKKLLVISDNHGNSANVEIVLDEFKKEVEAVVHCGDSEISPDALEAFVGEYGLPVYMAKGNCDYRFDREPSLAFEFEGHVCYLTHGHLEGANWGDEELIERAHEYGADLVFYGHTHVPAYRVYEEEGVTVFNPGSIALPRQYPAERTCMVLEFFEDGSVEPHFYTI